MEIRQILYDFANAVAMSDNDINGEERAWLDEIKGKTESNAEPRPSVVTNSDKPQNNHQESEEINNISKQPSHPC